MDELINYSFQDSSILCLYMEDKVTYTGGISEIAKNNLIGYPGFVVGGTGEIILLLFLFTGATV